MPADWTFPTVPPELKALGPFFQRAQELKDKDAIMAYWCTYYAAKQGISSKAQSKDARPFLFHVMTILEEMKESLGKNDAITDDDVGAVYIENFALRVFNMADNEDRKGEATRSTAKKFLAAANFFELLHIFDKPVDPDIDEKIRYSKWKAADIAKAFREGRKPTPGDANAPPSDSDRPAGGMLEPPQEPAPSMSAWSPGTSVAPSPAVHGMSSLTSSPVPATEVPLPSDTSSPSSAPEPTTPPRAFGGHLNLNHDHGYATPGMWSTMATPGTEDVYRTGEGTTGIGESPSVRAAVRRGGVSMDTEADGQDDAWSTAGNHSMSRQGSWTVVDGAPLVPDGSLPLQPVPEDGGLGLQSGAAPGKKVHFSPSVVGGLSSTSSSIAGMSPPGSPERFAPTLSTVPETSDSDRDTAHPAAMPLPDSESSIEGSPPVVLKVPSPTGPLSPNGFVPPPQLPSAPPQLPSAPPHLPSASSQLPSAPPHFPSAPVPPQFPSAPPQFPAAPPQAPRGLPSKPPTSHFGHRAQPPPPPPPRRSPSPPPELTSTQISKIQKHCKFAISALDYEDAHTARKELQAALAMLGG